MNDEIGTACERPHQARRNYGVNDHEWLHQRRKCLNPDHRPRRPCAACLLPCVKHLIAGDTTGNFANIADVDNLAARVCRSFQPEQECEVLEHVLGMAEVLAVFEAICVGATMARCTAASSLMSTS